ncbi:alpha/beta-hydrolase [Fistulina hepatica ATCC 64428]|uniref:Alpha/beta-hydrolase n=1 Tax=Fistulina hepatica ATCC 64428 TaxID=1128425 RepID=A0A0D7AP36_9AGAR|nr:alpha/beta-hydrolase [Fistulina hepatica ATCC 64428]
MPTVYVNSPSGPLTISYTISTPESPNAKFIDERLPTILLTHAVYVARELFQPVFADPHLRRFNLVAWDQRNHGETFGPSIKSYNNFDGANDLIAFMDALNLPPCHLFGIGSGSSVSLAVACRDPSRVLSLTLVSPLSMNETIDVTRGLSEIYDCWSAGLKGPEQDQLAIQDAIYGCCQLAWNSRTNRLISTSTRRWYSQQLKNWTAANLEEFRAVTVGFFKDSRVTMNDLSNVRCPVLLIHGDDDIAYPLETAQELHQAMIDSGIDAQLRRVKDATHFAITTQPKEVARLAHEFIVARLSGSAPPVPRSVGSPFDAIMQRYAAARPSDEEDEHIEQLRTI